MYASQQEIDAWLVRNTEMVSFEDYRAALQRADKFNSGRNRSERLYTHIQVAQWSRHCTWAEAEQYIFGVIDGKINN